MNATATTPASTIAARNTGFSAGRALALAETPAPLAWGLGHLAKVTYHQPTDSYIARCPDCDWATEPTLDSRSLHAAADTHYAENLG